METERTFTVFYTTSHISFLFFYHGASILPAIISRTADRRLGLTSLANFVASPQGNRLEPCTRDTAEPEQPLRACMAGVSRQTSGLHVQKVRGDNVIVYS